MTICERDAFYARIDDAMSGRSVVVLLAIIAKLLVRIAEKA